MDDAVDKLMGRWHDLAEQSAELIERQFTRSSQMLVKRVLREALGFTEVEHFQSAAEFARYVVELRENERAWSRRLGGVILLAQEQKEKGDIAAARKAFEDFEGTCPWRIFVDIAEIQRQNGLPQ